METTVEQTKREPTLSDVARAAGVSVMTASRAMRGRRDVADTTKAIVASHAQILGYNCCKQCGGGAQFTVREFGAPDRKFCSRICVAAYYST